MSRFLSSTIGKKVVVALTGLLMFGFLLGHLAGNLLVFVGPDMFNAYAAALKAKPPLVWSVRMGLLAAVCLHIIFTVQLAARNKASRGGSYEVFKPQKARLGSTFMLGTGLILASYIVYHLLHFTVGSAHPSFQVHDVYANVITGFRVVWSSVFYIAAMICLGFHLNHGVSSLFQTLGLNHVKYNGIRIAAASFVAVVIPAGFSSVPLAVLLGVLK